MKPVLTLTTALLAGLAICQSATEQRQMTFKDLLNDGALPSKIAPAEIPTDFRAVRIKVQGGGGGIMDMLGGGLFGMMGMLGGMMGGQSDGPPMEFINALELSWSNGDTISVLGNTFLITYKIDLGLAEMAGMDEKKEFKPDLRLILVRTEAIQTFTPEPSITKQKYLDALAKAPKPKKEEAAPPPSGSGGDGGDGGH